MLNKRRILIEIPEKDLLNEFGWFRQGMGECAIRTYLIKHPHIIEQGLSLNDFLGFSIWFKSTQEADMVFRREGIYYIIETKQKGKYYRRWGYLRKTVECFEAEMKDRKEEIQEIVAVLATSSEAVEKLSVQSLKWFSETSQTS
jgi:hypothetical protein